MWSVKCRVWSVKCRVWSVKCRVCSVELEGGVWSAKCKIRVWSAKCGVAQLFGYLPILSSFVKVYRDPSAQFPPCFCCCFDFG